MRFRCGLRLVHGSEATACADLILGRCPCFLVTPTIAKRLGIVKRLGQAHAVGVMTKPTTADRLVLYAQRRRQLIEETEEVRAKLADAIRDAAAAGMRQVDIVRTTGYTREQVRNIVAGRTR